MASVTPSSYNSPLLEDQEIKSTQSRKWRPRTLCIAALCIMMVVIAFVAYFNFGARLVDGSLKNSNTAKVLMTRKKSGKYHLSEDYVRQTREELVAEAISRKAELASDVTKTTSYYNADGEDDLIESMPFLDESTCSASATNCAFKQYSGYLLATTNREIHYWYMEADVEGDPMDRPLFIWTNGGPGCSGLMGLLTEQGAWRVQDDHTVTYNADSWISEVNMVFLEQPYGVGFSDVDEGRECVGGDDAAAWDMDAVIRNFVTKFPRFEGHEIYTTAESWGGHYVPRTAWQILVNNEAGYEPHINYKGFIVGNPYTNYYENTYGFVDSLYGHGLMNAPDYDFWKEQCWDNTDAIDNSEACYAVYVAAYYSAYNSNVYALDWDQCYTEEDWGSMFKRSSHVHKTAERFLDRLMVHDETKLKSLGLKMGKKALQELHTNLQYGQLKPLESDKLKPAQQDSWSLSNDAYVPCLEYNAIYWMARLEVQTALNVKYTNWSVCSDPVYDEWLHKRAAKDGNRRTQKEYITIYGGVALTNDGIVGRCE